MLSQLKLTLDSDHKLNWKKSSNLQGVLFEHVDTLFAAKMHEQSIHPYSQYLVKKEDHEEWYISALNDYAYEEMILPLLSPGFDSFELKDDIPVTITGKELKTIQDRELMDEFNSAEDTRSLWIDFLTPTSFKQNGAYNILPDPRLIIQSLMSRYSAASPDFMMSDADTLEELSSKTVITRYRLQSMPFPVEKSLIPGFMGSISLRVNGNATMSRYLYMLLHFGEFSGVGVKTGMGMGAIRAGKGGKQS